MTKCYIGIPRERGDQPWEVIVPVGTTEAFPVSAGINRDQRDELLALLGIPRERGDQPIPRSSPPPVIAHSP